MASPEQNPTPVANEGNSDSSRDRSAESSNPASREGSRPPRKKHNVRFTAGGESLDTSNRKAAFDLRDDTNAPPKPKPIPKPRLGSGTPGRSSVPSAMRRSGPEKSADITEETARAPVPRARPSIMRLPSSESDIGDNAAQSGKNREHKGKSKEAEDQQDDEEGEEDEDEDEEDDYAPAKAFSQQTALDRAQRLSRMIGSHSAPGSRYTSPHRLQGRAARSPPRSPPPESEGGMPFDPNDLPLEKLASRRTKFGIEDETDDEEDEGDAEKESPSKKRKRNFLFYDAATRLIGHRTGKGGPKPFRARADSPESRSGAQTPVYERDPDNYVPRPNEYRQGFLSSILKLYENEGLGSAIAHIPSGPGGAARAAGRSLSATSLLRPTSHDGVVETPAQTPSQTPAPTPGGSPTSSGTTTPKQKHQKWYYKNQQNHSSGALSDLVSSSTVLAQPGGSKQSSVVRPKPKHRPLSHQAMDTLLGKGKKAKAEDSLRLQVHLADLKMRHDFLLKMCRALMSFGAPTHRLEEYMKMCSRVLEIEGQFLYLPNCMIISFDDPETHTTEVKLVRTTQFVNLGKLRDTHSIYKEVVHDIIGVEEAMERLEAIIKERNKYGRWVIVLMYGLASACVGPFAFGARWVDLPIAFILGALLGILQHIIAPKSELYTNVFEVSAAVLTSFLARAFGSLKNGDLFCFSALCQSAIALILPGYTVLCGSLELQSRNMVAGSVRMVYAIIYSLFLGFGITIGTSFYGGIDKNATSDVSCRTETPTWYKFMFVPPFTLCLIIINQGKWKQTPIMMIIAFIGFAVNHFSALRFSTNVQIANTLGALAIGILGNLYSRLRHGLAAAALLPAIYVQVPSGLAASGSLVSGITSANQITKQDVNGTVANGTTTVSSATTSATDVNSMIFNVGYSMIQVAIGITVGLFLSALVVYPFGKRRSGLFSF